MKRISLGLLALLQAAPLLAAPEGAVVTPGPMTALSRLDSVPALTNTTQQRRAFNVQSWTTAQGTRVLFVRAPELPMLDLRLVFDAGSARDGKLAGLASVTNRMLDEGTPTRDTTQIANAFENVAAEFRQSSYRDMAVAELRVLTDPQFLNPALDVFADVMAHPTFPEDTYKRIFQGAEVGQQQQKQSPSTQAALLFFKTLYGSHPYATPTTGTTDSLKQIRVEDLRDFHKRYYTAGNAVLAMVGDVSEEQARQISERLGAALPAGEHAPALPEVLPLKKASHVTLPFASEQTHILLGQPGITRLDPDYYPLLVGNEILGGGGFGSWLTTEIREKRGLTYGVYSSFSPMRSQGPFLLSLSTRTDQADEALRLMRQVLKQFIEQGPTSEQVQDAVSNLVGSYPLDTASNYSIVGNLGMIGFYGLPLDQMDRYVRDVQAVTPEQIRDAFRRHVQPERMLLVTVGKKAPGGK